MQAGEPARGETGARTVPPVRFHARRWSIAEMVAGAGSLVLLVSLFLTWFSAVTGSWHVTFETQSGITREITFPGSTASVSGVSAHWYLWLAFVGALVVLLCFVARALWSELPFGLGRGELVLLGATGVNFVLTLIGFLLKPVSGYSWEYGAYMALVTAVVALGSGVWVFVRTRMHRRDPVSAMPEAV